jgi:uncharacterized cupin superfamily protein
MMSKKKPTENEIKETGTWGNWSKEPSVFTWYYDEKETCYILEGSATVTASDGTSLSFEKGDLVTFEQGLDCTWKIDKTIRKKYRFG